MAIVFPAGIPAPAQMTINLKTNVQRSVSMFNQSQQLVELLGSHWELTATWGIVDDKYLPALRAFLVSLNGGVVPFWFGDASATEPTGDVTGDVVVTATDTLNIVSVNCPADLDVVIFRAGDYIQIPVDGGEGYEYKMVLADVTTTATGDASISFQPPLRHNATNGDLIIYENPRGVFQLNDNNHVWNISAPNNGDGFTINARELVV